MAKKTIVKIISATDASNHFGSLIDEAAKGRSHFVITRMGKARAVVIGIEHYGNLIDQLETREEEKNTEFQRSLREAREEYELGKVLSEQELDEEFGFSRDMFSGEEPGKND